MTNARRQARFAAMSEKEKEAERAVKNAQLQAWQTTSQHFRWQRLPHRCGSICKLLPPQGRIKCRFSVVGASSQSLLTVEMLCPRPIVMIMCLLNI